jgi:hypothetical protein
LLGPFINSFIMICESMLSVSQDGLLREMLSVSKYRLQIFDYILYIPTPPAVTNLFSRAFQQLKSIGSGKCNPLENV